MDVKGECLLKAVAGLPKKSLEQRACCGSTSLMMAFIFLFFREPGSHLVLLYRLPPCSGTAAVPEVRA